MKPKIIISCGPAIDRQFFSAAHVLNKTYSAAVAVAGGIPIMPVDMSAVDDLLLWADGLVLSGSHSYSPVPGLITPEMNHARMPHDIALTKAALKAGKPILGICLGQQVINLALGGDLAQMFKLQMGVEHMMTKHTIKTTPNSLLRELYGEEFWVNSRHNHKIGTVAEGLKVTAWSPDGVEEAIEHDSLPILAVQWHPERMRTDFPEPPEGPDMTSLFDWFIRLCKKER